MIERPDYMTEEEWQEFLREHKPKERKAKRESNGGDDGFVRGDAGQILKGHPGNIALAIKLLGITLKQNDFSGRTEIAGCPDSGRISLMRELSESASRFMKPSALCHRCNCSSTP